MVPPMQHLAAFFSNHLIKPLAKEADEDADAVSMHWLCLEDDRPGDAVAPPIEAAGAMVFIKGDAAARAFAKWAEGQGYLSPKPLPNNPAKPWQGSKIAVLERGDEGEVVARYETTRAGLAVLMENLIGCDVEEAEESAETLWDTGALHFEGDPGLSLEDPAPAEAAS